MCIKLGRVRLRVTFLAAAALAFALNSQNAASVGLTLAGALLHECAHLALLLSYGCTGLTLTLRPGGAVISGADADSLSPRKTLVAVLAGPGVNFALAGALAACARAWAAQPLREAAFVNLLLGAANLLPLSFLDGGRALSCLREIRTKSAAPTRGTAAVDAVTVGLLFALAAALLLQGRRPVFLCLFTAYCAAAALAARRRGP